MLMIDKHAAHERILFESMRKNREKAEKVLRDYAPARKASFHQRGNFNL